MENLQPASPDRFPYLINPCVYNIPLQLRHPSSLPFLTQTLPSVLVCSGAWVRYYRSPCPCSVAPVTLFNSETRGELNFCGSISFAVQSLTSRPDLLSSLEVILTRISVLPAPPTRPGKDPSGSCSSNGYRPTPETAKRKELRPGDEGPGWKLVEHVLNKH